MMGSDRKVKLQPEKTYHHIHSVTSLDIPSQTQRIDVAMWVLLYMIYISILNFTIGKELA